MDNAKKKENRLEWYVMGCRKAEEIGEKITEFNSQAAELDQIVSNFIPAEVFRIDDDSRVDEVRMRSTLSRFVFLRVRPSGLEAFQMSWLPDYGIRLYHYRNHLGDELTATDTMMEQFIAACHEYGAKFEVCTLPPKIAKGIKVKVREGTFKNLDAEVVEVQYSGGSEGDATRFTIAVKLFSSDHYALIRNCQSSDVIFDGSDVPVFSLGFIDNIQDQLLAALWQKSKGGKIGRNSFPQLWDYYRLRHATFDDCFLAARFTALMSICASLMGNCSGKSKYNKLLKHQIRDDYRQSNALASQKALAWSLIALFISTRDADYRMELKTLVPTIAPRDEAICRFLTVIRKL